MQPGGAGKTEPDQGNLKPGVIIWILWIAADIRLHALMPFHNKFHPVTKLLPFINIIQRVPWLRLLTFITWNFIETHTNRKCHKSWPVPGSPSRIYWPRRACLGQQRPLNCKMTFWKLPELPIHRLSFKVSHHQKRNHFNQFLEFNTRPSPEMFRLSIFLTCVFFKPDTYPKETESNQK